MGRGKAITVGTLYLEARAHGWVHPVIEELNARLAFVRMGSKVAVAEFRSSGDIESMTTAAFRELFMNRRHGRKTLGNAWLMHSKRRTYPGGLAFRPDGKVPSDTRNLWTGFALRPNTEIFCEKIIQL